MANHLWKVTAKRDSGNIAKGMSVEILSEGKPFLSVIVNAIKEKYDIKNLSLSNTSYFELK